VDFIREHAGHQDPGGLRWGVEPICRALAGLGVKIAPSTYYEWKDAVPSRRQERDAVLAGLVRQVFDGSHHVYGAEKIWLQLNRDGHRVARCTVERLMRREGIGGVTRQRTKKKTTVADRAASRPGDLVERQFDPPAPNRLWVADITYVSTWAGWVFVAFVLDAYARHIVGWKAGPAMTADLVIDALDLAVTARRRAGHANFTRLVGHTDHGSQYTSVRYAQRLAEYGITPSTGTVGDSYDNAVAETLNGTYKAEVIYHPEHGPWYTCAEVEYATAQWVWWYNHHRLHEYCSGLTPIECETLYYQRHEHTMNNISLPN
jgi:putative transposase